MLKVYYTDIDPLRKAGTFSKKLALVNEMRSDKILAYQNTDDQCRGLAAGLLLRLALEKEGIDYEKAEFAKEAYGKPYILDSPLCFNLAHAGRYAVCAVSNYKVGVDIESMKRFDGNEERMQKLSQRILTTEEKARWEIDESGSHMVRIWSRKESYAKMTGKGLMCDFSEINTISGTYYHERFMNEYYMAVCTNVPTDEIEWIGSHEELYPLQLN
ncbi:MAG: 4'-phosphopantetheinyl transferase superfamily protein [Lachnospiraceae bacterium]|nr:4'-phosphopantetheinyl transferase superfamily protein [Lachnospiraceae bacterium]